MHFQTVNELVDIAPEIYQLALQRCQVEACEVGQLPIIQVVQPFLQFVAEYISHDESADNYQIA
jgi:hypothetical protein